MPRDATSVASRVAAGLAFTGCLAGPAAAADAFPSRPITMIVVFAPGGPTDVLARIVGEDPHKDVPIIVIFDNV